MGCCSVDSVTVLPKSYILLLSFNSCGAFSLGVSTDDDSCGLFGFTAVFGVDSPFGFLINVLRITIWELWVRGNFILYWNIPHETKRRYPRNRPFCASI